MYSPVILFVLVFASFGKYRNEERVEQYIGILTGVSRGARHHAALRWLAMKAAEVDDEARR
jgi:hypothetical protein